MPAHRQNSSEQQQTVNQQPSEHLDPAHPDAIKQQASQQDATGPASDRRAGEPDDVDADGPEQALVPDGDPSLLPRSRKGEPTSIARQLRDAGLVAVALPAALALVAGLVLPQQTLVIVVAAVLGAVAGGFWLLRRIPMALHPIELLHAEAEPIVAGDHGHRLEPFGVRELNPLVAQLNSLAERFDETDARFDALLAEVGAQLQAPSHALEQGLTDLQGRLEESELTPLTREVRRVHSLGGDLKQLARAEQGRPELELQVVDLQPLVAQVAARMRPQFEAAGVTLHELVPGPVKVRADRRECARVLVNLLGNALQACADSDRAEVLVGLARTNLKGRPVARLTVTDNGVGLASEELGPVFERFHRAPGGRPGPGSGLGLTISRGLVRAQGGELSLTSPGIGRGATATIVMPVAD